MVSEQGICGATERAFLNDWHVSKLFARNQVSFNGKIRHRNVPVACKVEEQVWKRCADMEIS